LLVLKGLPVRQVNLICYFAPGIKEKATSVHTLLRHHVKYATGMLGIKTLLTDFQFSANAFENVTCFYSRNLEGKAVFKLKGEHCCDQKQSRHF
jgi:hypothetical protein